MQDSTEPDLKHNVSLRPYNTLQVEAVASDFITLSSSDQLPGLFQKGILQKETVSILGGGSNILFTGTVDKLVLKNEIMHITVTDETDQHVRVRSGAGVVWHDLVTRCVENQWGGIENLALIPGTVGAAPIQNIGAYGVELNDVFESLVAFDLDTGEFRTFEKEECEFAYRNSIFKQAYKNRFLITSVTLRLQKQPHSINVEYESLKKWLDKEDIESPAIEDVFRGVVSIRKSKLPDPKDIGNAGSFFKNPVIPVGKFESLKEKYDSIPSYPADEKSRKIPAAWLIEQAGWKGKRIGDVGTYEKQALVIVNHGRATGEEILSFAERIRNSVKEKFDIDLEHEVNIIGQNSEFRSQ